MKLLWTKSSSPLSKIIRLITGQDCSHFSFVFEGPERTGLMFESNLLGTHPCFLETSLKTHTIVHSFEIPLTVEQEDLVWDLCIEKYDGKGYDFKGALYLGFRIILERLFKIKRPSENKWANDQLYFCDEVYDIFNRIPGLMKIDVSNGMDTPHDVYMTLQGGK